MLTTWLFRTIFLLASLQWPVFSTNKYVLKEESPIPVPSTTLNMAEYCPRAPGCMIPGMHILCLDQLLDFGPDCYKAEEIVITPDIAVRILTLFNLMRSRLAKGLEQLGKDQKPIPQAYGMNLLHWDSELATFAQLWAKQCQLGTDACHGSVKFPLSSQLRMDIRFDENWIDIHENKQYNFTHNFNDILMKILSNIYNGKDKLDLTEIFECKTQCIGEPRFDDPAEFNAYPYVINSDSTHVGCGMATFVKRFYSDVKKYRYQKIVSLICNFSHPLKVDEPICNFTAPTTTEYSNCGCGPDTVETRECLCTVLKGHCTGIGCLPPVLLLPIFTAEPAAQSKRLGDNARRNGLLKNAHGPPTTSAITALTSVENASNGEQVKSTKEQPQTPKRAPTLLDEEASDKRRSLKRSLNGHGGPEWEELSQNDEVQRPPRYSKHGPKDSLVQTPPKKGDLFSMSSNNGRRKSKSKKRHLNSYSKIEDVLPRKNYDVVQSIFNKYMQARRQANKDNPYMKLINRVNATDLYEKHGTDRVLSEHIAPALTVKNEDNYDQLITPMPNVNTDNHPFKQSLVEMIDKLEEQLGSMRLTNEVRGVLNKKINGIYSILSNKHTNHLQPELNDKQEDIKKHQEHETVILSHSHSPSAFGHHKNLEDLVKHKLRVIDNNNTRGKHMMLPANTPRKEVVTEEIITKEPKVTYEHYNHNYINTHPKHPHSTRNKKENQYEKIHVTNDHELAFKRMRPVKAVSAVMSGKATSKVARIPTNSLGKRPIISNEQDRNRHYEDDDDDQYERSPDVDKQPSRLKRTDSEESTEDIRKDSYEERGGRKLYK